MITVVLNRPLQPATEGETSRLHAIVDHLRRRDPSCRVLCADPYRGDSRPGGLLRNTTGAIGLAFRALRSADPILLVSAPALPFFDSPSRIDLFLTRLFLGLLRRGKRLTGGIVVLNMHDLRSLQLPDFDVVLAPAALEAFRGIERASIAASDFVLAWGGDWPEYLAREFDLSPEQIVEFPNGCVRHPSEDPPGLPDLPPGVRFAYAGTMSHRAGSLEQFVDRFRRVERDDISLVLAGPGGEWAARISAQDPRVRYLGVLPVETCIAVLRRCHVGVYPYPPRFYFDMTYHTNKMALYLTCGLPILARNSRAVSRFVRDAEIGAACELDDIPEQVERIAADPALLARWRENLAPLADRFYWDGIIDRAFETIAQRRGLEVPWSRE